MSSSTMPRALARSPRTHAGLAAAVVGTLLLAGCGAAGTTGGASPSGDGGSGDATSSGPSAAAGDVVAAPAEDGALPATITHAYGETTIEEAPVRVVTIGWAASDIAAALGTVPVGQDSTWGGDDEGVSQWFRAQAEELGAPMPEILAYDDSGEIDLEQILALEPDVILAPHSGLTQTQYDRLTEIAPTVPFAERPWASESWQTLITTVGEALGQPQRAEEVVAETEQAIADAAAEHPEFEGVSFVYGSALTEGATDATFYTQDDPRVQLVEDLGFVSTPSMDVIEAGVEGENYTGDVSLEQLDSVDADIFLGWGAAPENVTYTLDHPTFSRWEPIASGHFAFLDDNALTMATSAPTPLSVEWALPQYTTLLATAVEGGAAN